MTTLVAILGLILGGTGLGALLIKWFAASERKAGKLEQHNAEQVQADAAKDRANEVLAERRDPDAVSDRLRDGTF